MEIFTKSDIHSTSSINGTAEPNLAVMSSPPNSNSQKKIANTSSHAQRVSRIANAVNCILENIGENPFREGLVKTPERYAKVRLFFHFQSVM